MDIKVLDANGGVKTAQSGAVVTSVALSAAPASVFGVTGSPVTSTGTLALTMDNQNANIVLAGPTSGGAAEPAFRALVTADMPFTFPKRATMWGDEATVLSGAALQTDHDTSQNYATISYQNAGADGDQRTWSFFLHAGTYTLAVLGLASSAYGKVDWYIDGSSVITAQDWYAGSGTYNTKKTGSVTVATSGYHTLKATLNGKNASSSGYYFAPTKIWIYPASD